MNLTPEYPPAIKPERVGVYKTRLEAWISGYSYWHGDRWSKTYSTAEIADLHRSESAYQDKYWQGLAEDPNERSALIASLTALVEGEGGPRSSAIQDGLCEAIEALKETT